ncbi:GIY-YIG nuclease family protein [Hyphomicrobium sp. MC1]|uniref:GIY-YIG nuclease family protein n=1 Tax=Hyphomicrobium sp. (strain MC1) TaxID=717785 RepID=UPI000213DCE4|nr:GIY-YIG nuclease family protein [Hyphomicrobium sp. MC1]CCB64493.1 protein of unknown function [Hyphomicrobium sp. MC1]
MLSLSTVDERRVDEARPDPILLDLMSDVQVEATDKGRLVKTAHIYVIEADGLGLFKIGLSVDFKIRFPTYRTECPVTCWPLYVAIVPDFDVHQIEASLHERFAARRVKGEWFALTSQDVLDLADAIKDAAKTPIRRTKRELAKFGSAYNPHAVERLRAFEMDLAKAQARNEIPTHELVMDRFYHAAELGETLSMSDITKSIDRKPQAVHEAVRALLADGKIALVSPLRNPRDGAFQMEEYRRCEMMIPDASCDWEAAIYGEEILVSEPLGHFVPEFFGRHRTARKAADWTKLRFRRNDNPIKWGY